MSFIDDFVKAKPAGAKGDDFRHGRGTLILKDIKLFRGNDDPKIFVTEFIVKESFPTKDGVQPNAVGTMVKFMQKCTKWQGADSRVKAVLSALLGEEANSTEAVSELLRIGTDGYTKLASPCPGRGIEVRYSTADTKTKAGPYIVTAAFEHIMPDGADPKKFKAVVDANLKLLDGK